jgi:hypothetical protein
MLGTTCNVDWAEELGIDLRTIHLEAFWHPVAQWENARIARRGEDYWAWVRHCNPEKPSPSAKATAKARPMFEFTERQIEIALRSARGA